MAVELDRPLLVGIQPGTGAPKALERPQVRQDHGGVAAPQWQEEADGTVS